MLVKKEQRIFIKNLPETVTYEEIKTFFSKYGDVIAADIKERKNVNTSCPSKLFAYVTLKIDNRSLEKCFNYFANNLWEGQNVELQIAEQSFLERLKQEREEANVTHSDENTKRSMNMQDMQTKDNMKESLSTCLMERVNNISDAAHSGKGVINATKLNAETFHNFLTTEKTSVDNEFQEKKEADLPQSELKRVQSVNQMVKGYRLQKSAIKVALSNIDLKRNNKITFDEEIDTLEETCHKLVSSIKSGKKLLFEDDDHSENDFNFEVKANFEGKKGKELFELQAKYKNDKRFVLNEHFIEERDDDDDSIQNEAKSLEQIPLEEEKNQQFKILEQVLGNNFKSKTSNNGKNCFHKGGMLRFDPAQAEHLQYEMKNTKNHEANKRKHKSFQNLNENIEINQAKVSKQVFYNISGDLKGTLQNNEKFSLLNLCEVHEKPQNHEETVQEKMIVKSVNTNSEINPFRYDSSDDEMEEVHTKDEETFDKSEYEAPSSVSKFWTESFFFQNDDYRLQEGLDFLKKMASEKKDKFMLLRTYLKEIVKAKVRNSHRKNRAFKKKLGGSRKKKNIQIKKPMNR